MEPYALDFSQIRMSDVPLVGGKNASLGELYSAFAGQSIGVLDGFALTTAAYWRLLEENVLREKLTALFSTLDPENVDQLTGAGSKARALILATPLPADIKDAALSAYRALSQRLGHQPELAVRSSASAEDLPEASFAGAAETFLNVRGEQALLDAIRNCYASLFTDRAINYRARQGYPQMKVALSVGIMPMVRSDLGCSGVMFTLDTESGFRDVVTLSASYGLGEFIVKGIVTPDEWTVFKPTLRQGFDAIIGRQLGPKQTRLVYNDTGEGTRSEDTPSCERSWFCLNDREVLQLAQWGCLIEEHYSALAGHPQPMDIEWAKDGLSGRLYIVQARPETVHSAKRAHAAESYRLTATPGPLLLCGQAVGERIGVGKARIITSVSQLDQVLDGEVLVARNTDPDWEPVMRRVAAIVTDQGGRTAHAAIVSREFGIPCIVGTGNATQLLRTGQEITVCCTEGNEGHVYSGLTAFEIDKSEAIALTPMRTKIMLIAGDPSRAFDLAAIPNDGVGLARLEFIINNHIGIHPMALAHPERITDPAVHAEIRRRIGSEERQGFFVRRLSEGIGRIAAAFYPKPVIVRLSDFKSNEYAHLLGGSAFEPHEENPMLGFRGASRYYDPRYEDGFALECRALIRVRQTMGLTNVKVMVPFCRTLDEARLVFESMADHGLRQGVDGLEVYAMCEIPANVVLAEDFLKIFDGFSIGSNDLTQLTLGLDRDSGTVAHLFDENNAAVRWMIAHAIACARTAGKPIGICGQAPSDFPDFAAWLVQQHIGSISLNPDSAVKTAQRVAEAEAEASTPQPQLAAAS